MNRLLNAMDGVSEKITTAENAEFARRVRVFLIELFHKDETNLQNTDPNHPYTRFAKHGEAEGNRLRLFQALQEKLDEENADLQPVIDLMFEVPGTPAYTATTEMLRQYLRYADSIRGSDSDSDSSSDSGA